MIFIELNHYRWPKPLQGFSGTFQHFQFPSFDVSLDKIHTLNSSFNNEFVKGYQDYWLPDYDPPTILISNMR